MTLLSEALAEVGYTEDPPNSNRTKFAAEAGHLNGQPWCASFVVAMARRAGITLPSESAYTPTMAQAFRVAHQWYGDPQPGDVAFFDFPDSKHRIQHVGIVVEASLSTVTCIEGNTSPGRSGSQDNGGGVYRRTRPIAHAVGFGRPVAAGDEVTDEDIERITAAVTLETTKAVMAALGPKINKALNSLAGYGTTNGKRDRDIRSAIGRIEDHTNPPKD